MTKKFINPPTIANWEDVFSQLVVVTSGTTKTIYVSGQVSVDSEKSVIGPGDLKVQAMRAFQNLELALAAAAAKISDVVKLTIYVKDYQPADAALVNAALGKYFQPENRPASTWLGVQSLAEEEFLIEVDAIAVIETD